GFEFWKKKVLAHGHVVWRCSKHQVFKCKAVLVTNDIVVVKNINPEHTHEGNSSTAQARRAIGEMKKRAVDNLATPAATRSAVSSTLPSHVLMALPQKSAKRILILHEKHYLLHLRILTSSCRNSSVISCCLILDPETTG